MTALPLVIAALVATATVIGAVIGVLVLPVYRRAGVVETPDERASR